MRVPVPVKDLSLFSWCASGAHARVNEACSGPQQPGAWVKGRQVVREGLFITVFVVKYQRMVILNYKFSASQAWMISPARSASLQRRLRADLRSKSKAA